MASTIGANGLSIVHKGSGGEANASVPDVCLTKVGKPVVPIPYGNNAKSADLVDGSTSVTADGGNSIALQGSKFSKSTGDAAGDKKGVSSGTIEGEAQFVTSSPNVLIEGKGVARQSDQMTMNNGNTMCFGVQNPSFSVEEDLEETFIMDVCVRHPNGQRLVNAPFKLCDEQGSTVYEATLDEKGRSDADPLKGGKVKLLVEESQDPFVVTPVRRENPRHVDSQSDDDFFNIAAKGQRGFWQPTRIDTVGTAWGSIGQTLSSDRYFQDMVSAEVIQHFTHYHPDTTFDVSKTCDVLIGNLDQPLPHTTESLLAYTLPQVLEEGELLSVLLRLAPHETTDRMLAYMRARGKGNPQTYLADYDWQAAEKSINSELDALLNKLKSRLTFLRDEASKLQYAYLSEDVFDKHINTLSSYMKLLPDLISGVFSKMQTKASELLANTDNVKVIKAADDLHSIESESIEAVVNTTKTIDTVEPFMSEVAGVIENVIPIYPVRYGYANFFDELMPAQAPPSMTEMSSATGLKDTGGYLLRLLREGWLYIKEESEEDTAPFHIFKYAQTQTATGVIEKFEKYYFTNEENAQEGLTLDTSSGSTFYPFAFVTPKAKKISIAYSEHEWAAAIIDNMNNDEELRKKAMQQVDLTAQQTEFSQAATQDNLSALVEDYRNNDEKWLADKDSAKPMPHGLDLATTTLSYHLDAEGIVETMQKSHSEHKDGALVVLFDPVGRQRDLNHVLSFNVADEQAYYANNAYPLTIGKFAEACLSSDVPTIKEAAENNLNQQELSKYQSAVEGYKAKQTKKRHQLLGLINEYMVGSLAIDEVGSLPTYIKYFFEDGSEQSLEPEAELSKVLNLTAELLDGITASKEGITYLDDWVGQSFSSDQNDISVGILFKTAKILFTQCQNAFPWDEAPTKLTLAIGPWLASVHADLVYDIKSGIKETRLGTNQGLKRFATETLPDMIEILYGIARTGATLEFTVEELEKIIQDLAKKGKLDVDPYKYRKGKLNIGSKLYEWADDIADHAKSRVIKLDEIRITKKAPAEIKEMVEKAPVKTLLHLTGEALDKGFAAWSFYANVDAIQSIVSQSDYEKADPVNDAGSVYRVFALTGYMTAISVDTATLAHGTLKITNKALPRVSGKLTAKVGPNLKIYEHRLGSTLAATAMKRLIFAANMAVSITNAMSAYRHYRSGNQGAAIGHGMQVAASFYLGLAVYVTVLANPVALTIAFATLVSGVFIADHYTKSNFENLLYSCFWGNSETYPFWAEFTDSDLVINPDEKVKYYFDAKNGHLRPYFDAALSIESQEFFNYFYMPTLNITDRSVKPYNGPSKTMLTYEFILPEFIKGESQLYGTVYSDLNQKSYPLSQKPEPDERATQALKQAVTAAINNITSDDFKQSGLYLIVHVEFDQPVTLFWSYEPKVGLVVPKRSLSGDTITNTKLIGMKDEQPNETPWGK
ncbi:PAAR-like domain-containing protein [Vibrio parahaemolyticus]|uniref:PAAR-like domain-containing protein n=1 Tax=Vibrio parahaemolyticus TaxID=670 RepID=UPI003D81B226